MWFWQFNSAKRYVMCNAYDYLTVMDSNVIPDDNYNIQRCSFSLFVWRLLFNRLSTKDNLLKKEIISLNNCLCLGGCGSLEDRDHFYLQDVIFS